MFRYFSKKTQSVTHLTRCLRSGTGRVTSGNHGNHHHGYSTTTSATPAIDKAKEYRQGQQIHGYTVEQVASVPELFLTAIKLKHNNTGADHMHVARDDSNNVFGVAFRTTPMDDTGVPHILEHTALCGSEKYPVRDPFFKMLTRSLSTFMNAFTASDWTMYPFSSQNAQDYQNLMSVYLDAVFFPQLRELDFRQEGWRLENENLQDPKSPITFKGVVFNEMKGVFSVSHHLFAQKAQNLLQPSHTYSVVYGGDPAHIPDLSWQQLRDFHASHYHPSNSRFYTYGNLPLEQHLEFISEHALNKFGKIDPGTEVPLEPRWQSPREAAITCNPDPMLPDPTKQTTVAVSYLLQDVTNTFEAYTMSILGALLTHGEKSPFYQALLEANIGSDFSPIVGYNGNTREATFAVGLQGIKEDDVDRVKTIIKETIDKVIEEGFEQERIDAILHMIELGQKHQTDKFGLYLGVGLASSWIHDGDPIEALQVTKQVNKFKTCLETIPNFLQDKVKQYFKDNNHKLTLVMSPDAEFESKRQQQEKEKLDTIVSQLTPADREEVYKKGLELLETQMAEEDLSCLPTLTVSDIQPQAVAVETSTHYAKAIPIQLSAQPTNGVTYFRALTSIAGLPENLKPYVSLFCDVATKMGAGVMDFKELSQQIELKTGGLTANTFINEHHSVDQEFEQSIMFSSMCLDRNTEAMFDLWTEIFHSMTLTDTNRLMTLVMMSAADLASSVADSGHSYAMGHAASSLSASAAVREQMGGMKQVSLMKAVAEMSDLQPIVDILRSIAHHVLTRENLRCSVNASPESLDKAAMAADGFVGGLNHPLDSKPEKIKPVEFYHKDTQFHGKPQSTHFELPFQVNYASRSVASVPYTHSDFPSLRVLAKLLTTRYLHREIREKGGAYGGGAASSAGNFSFYSYRDPNSTKTLETFESAVDWAMKGSFNQQDIDEAKLSVFSQVDMPVPPGNRGMRLFQYGIDDETFQKHRQGLFAVSKDDLVRVTDTYLTPEKRTSSVALLGPENPALQSSGNWTIKKS